MALNFGLLGQTGPAQVADQVYQGWDQANQSRLQALAMAKAQREADDDRAVRNAFRDAGGDVGKLQTILMERGLYDQANTVAGQQLKRQQAQAAMDRAQAQVGLTQAQTERTRAQTQSEQYGIQAKRAEELGRAGAWLARNPTPQNERQTLDILYQRGAIDEEVYQKGLAELSRDPTPEGIARRAQLAAGMGLKPEDTAPKTLAAADLGDQKVIPQYDPLTGKVSVAAAMPMGQSPNNAATQATAALNREAANQRANERNAVMLQRGRMADTRIPAGYRPTANGELEAIPGGPADYKRQQVAAQGYTVYQTALDNMDALSQQAEAVMNHPGLAGITGLRGKLPNVPGGDAADAAAQLETLKSKTAVAVLQAMRDASKTGGAVGQVTEAEWPRLENNIAALNTSQSVDEFKQRLQDVQNWVVKARQRTMKAYLNQPDMQRINPTDQVIDMGTLREAAAAAGRSIEETIAAAKAKGYTVTP